MYISKRLPSHVALLVEPSVGVVFPVGHFIHDGWPSIGWKVPRGHLSHDLVFLLKYVPGGHLAKKYI